MVVGDFFLAPVSCNLFPETAGGVAQLGERLPCTQEAIGSNPFTSTRKEDKKGQGLRELYGMWKAPLKEAADVSCIVCSPWERMGSRERDI